MKSRKIYWIVCVVFLLTIGWFWRYSSLNRYYRSLSDKSRETYQIGEIVPFGTDFMDKDMCVDGYSIRVNKFEIEDYDSYLASAPFTLENAATSPDKVALVYVTLLNENSNAEGVMLTELKLHGIDNYSGLNWDILLAANPVLKGNYGIRLSTGTEYDLVIPFDLDQTYYGAYTWKHLDEYELFLRITAFPTEKDIQVQ